MDEVKKIKTDCLKNPERKLWKTTKKIKEVQAIFRHITQLSYLDKPDYEFIK